MSVSEDYRRAYQKHDWAAAHGYLRGVVSCLFAADRGTRRQAHETLKVIAPVWKEKKR